MTPQAQQYYERKLSYVPITGDPLEDYRRRRDRLERELDDVGVSNPESRYQITMRLLGQEPIQQGSFFGERVPAAAGRGADKFGMNVGAMTEYFGRQLESPGMEEFGQEMAARNRQMLDRSPAPYASPEEQEQQGFLRRMDDLLLQAGEETIGSAPAIVPPLAGAAIGGAPGAALGFAGVLGANAALEGGSTYSDRKQYYMRQGMPEEQAAQQAKKEADEIAIANLTDPELVALAGIQGGSGAIAKSLLPNAGRAARYGSIGGLQAGSGALQEGRQYEVSETATGNPMDQFSGRFSTPEGRNAMLVGAISEVAPTVVEGALAADPRVDPVATDLKRRTQDAAYDAVSADDALEAQRLDALRQEEEKQRQAAEQRVRQENKDVQDIIKQQQEAYKRQLQIEREQLKLMSERARYRKETEPETETKQIADDKLPGEREAEALRIPKSGLWQDGEEITDPTFDFGRQKQPGEDVDFTMKEGGFDSRLPQAPERPAPEPEPQQEFTMRDSAIEMPAGPIEQPAQPAAPAPQQIEQQQDYNYPVPAAPAPAPMEQEQEADLRVEDPMETTQEDVTPTPEEDTLSTEVAGQVAGQDFVQDQTESVVEDTETLPESLPVITSNLSPEFQAIADLERQQEALGPEAEQAGVKWQALIDKRKSGQKLTKEEDAERSRLSALKVAFNKLDRQIDKAYKPYQAEVDRLEQEVGNAVEALPLADRQRFSGLFRKEVDRQAINPDDEVSQLRLAQQLIQQLREGGLATKEEIAAAAAANADVETETVDTAALEEFSAIYDEDRGPSAEDLAALEAEGLSDTTEEQKDSELFNWGQLRDLYPSGTELSYKITNFLQKEGVTPTGYITQPSAKDYKRILNGTNSKDLLNLLAEYQYAEAVGDRSDMTEEDVELGSVAVEKRLNELGIDGQKYLKELDEKLRKSLTPNQKPKRKNNTDEELARLIAEQGSDIEQDRGAAALRDMGDTNEVGFDEGSLYDPNAQDFNIRDEEYTIDGDPRGLRFSYSAASRPTNAAGPSTKLTARQVKAAMEGVKSVLKKLDPNGDRVTVAANKAEAVAKLREMGRDRDAADLASREGSLEEGFTLPDTGNIVLIADQIQGQNLRGAVDRMVEVTFHEALGHAGLRGLMGEKFDGFIKNFGIKNGKKIDAWMKTKDAQPYVTKDRNTQIEEYIAKNFAETGAKDVGFIENLAQNVLSSLGLRQYSETALKKIMQQVQQEFVDGNGNIIEGAQRGTRDVEEAESTTPEPRTRRVRRGLGKPPAGIDAADYKNVVQQILDDNSDLNPTTKEVETALKTVVRKIPTKLRSSFLSDREVFNVSPDQTQGNRVDYGEATSSSNRETIRRQVLEEIQKRKDTSFVEETLIRSSSRPTSNLIGGQVPLSEWTTPTESKMDDFIYTMQDKMVDTKRVVESIKKAAGAIDDRWNPYLQEELYHGRTAKETKDFLTNELQPLMEDLQRFNISIKDFDNYLWNRHAEERNIQMAKVNPDMPDGGSGIDTAKARDYLTNLSPQKRRVFEQLAQRVDNITSQTRQILKDSSLESAETIDNWEGVYEKYVPLQREEFDFQPMQPGAGIGQGLDVRGSASRRAVGSERGVIDVLANVALQRERAITRSNKNKVAQAVYGLAAQNPNTDFWLVIDPAGQKDVRQLAQTLKNMGLPSDIAENFAKEPVTTTTDSRTGQKVSRINASIRNSDNYLATRINGEDKFVIFNAKNPSSQRMVRALKNLDADQLGRVMGILGNVTRWMTSVNTQYNPIFGVVNLLRDVQGALINLTSTPIGNKQAQVAAGTLPALKGIYSTLRGDTARQNQYSQLWEEFQQEGGQTGYKDMFARSDERATALEKELKGLSASKPIKSLKAIRDWLSDYNEAMENAVRLSAYKVAKEQGMTNQQAASLAKNLTVNFNRKGQVATQAGALYSFFNAAVQGTARMMEALRGPAGKKIIYGGLLLGTAQAALLEAADFDEDEPPYFVREKNVIIPLIGGGYLTIPMPLGLNIIPNTSRVITEFALSGFREPTKRVGQITGSLFDAFNPIGNAGWSVQTIAPTVADPLVALSENRDWTGRPIAKEDMVSTRPTPGYTRAKETASTLSTGLAYFLNAASGGTDYQKGLFSPTPDQLDYLVGQAFGGVGRELLKAEQTVTSTFTGEELPPYKIPLAGRFYGNTESSAAASNRFYTNITRLNEHEAEIKGRRENRENVAEYLRDYPEARLAGFAGQVERAVRKLQKRKRDMLDRGASSASIEAIEKLITRRMQTLNDRVERFAEMAN